MAQDIDRAKSEAGMTWYGIDFTQAKFTLVTEDPALIVNQYLKAINQLILMEPEKYDLKKFFNKSEVTHSLDQVNERNSKINPEGLVIGDSYPMDLAQVKNVLSGLNTQGKTGLGLIFVAGNLSKPLQTGTYYVVFFNESNKEIVDARYFEGKAVGIGFRNYWTGSVYNIMKVWLKSK
jgi:hypothetical protein